MSARVALVQGAVRVMPAFEWNGSVTLEPDQWRDVVEVTVTQMYVNGKDPEALTCTVKLADLLTAIRVCQEFQRSDVSEVPASVA